MSIRYTGEKKSAEGVWIHRSTALALVVLVSLAVHPFSVDAQQILRMIGPEDVGGAWAEVIRRFHAGHPDIRIDYLSGPWSTDERQNMIFERFWQETPSNWFTWMWSGRRNSPRKPERAEGM